MDEHFQLTKIKHKINIFIEILELKQPLLAYSDLIRQKPVDKRPINDKFQLKYLTWKTKEFYHIQIDIYQKVRIFKCIRNVSIIYNSKKLIRQ